MNDSRFDDIVRRLARAADGRGTRRGLLRVGAAAGLAKAVGVPDVCAAAPAPGALPADVARRQESPDDRLVEQIAFDLEYDVERMFAFVRDEIAYEAYDGALRGVRGTLWSGAGNAVDQAQLLAALVRLSAGRVRFAFGGLPPEREAELAGAQAAPRSLSATLARARANLTGDGSGGGSATPTAVAAPEVTEEQRAAVDRLAEMRDALLDEAGASIQGETERLTRLLTDAGYPPSAPPVAAVESARHVWLQVRSGADWVDLAPAFPDAEPGDAPAETTETVEELPDALFHTVRIRLTVETLSGESLTETVVIDRTMRSQDLVGEQILLMHVEPQMLRALGTGVNEALSGQIASYPLLVLGEETYLADAMVTFGTGEGALGADGLGEDTALPDGECLAERYEVTVSSPGSEPVVVERFLFDRVPAAQRRAGTIVRDEIPPMAEIDLGNGERAIPEMKSVVTLASVVSDVDPDFLDRLPAPDDAALAGYAGAVHGIHALRQRLDAERVATPGVYLIRPNVAAYTLGVAPDGSAGVPAARIDADLLVQGYGYRATGEGQGVYAGVLAQRAEWLAVSEAAVGAMLEAVDVPVRPQLTTTDVKAVFEAADAAGIEIVVVSPGAADALDAIGAGEATTALMRRALADGHVVVAPGRVVPTDGGATVAWWVYDPLTGALRDQTADGRGGARMVLDQPMGGYAFLTRLLASLRTARGFFAAGGCVFAIFRAAAAIIQQDPGRPGGFDNRVGNVGGAIFACGAFAAGGAAPGGGAPGGGAAPGGGGGG